MGKKYDPNTREQIFELKGNRTVFKTHNGFKCHLQDKNDVVTPISQEYYTKVKRSKL
jgi:hypothetical protein